MRIEKILVAIDFSDESLTALQKADALASSLGCELHVLHVIPSLVYRGVAYVEPLSPDAHQRERDAAAKALEDAVNGLGSGHSPATTEVLEGEPRSVILSHAKEIGADLIVLASKGHGRIHDVLLGSVAAHVSHAAKCSVLIVKG